MEINAQNSDKEAFYYRDICVRLFFPAGGRAMQDCIISVLRTHIT